MKLRTRLIAVLLSCGLLPLMIFGVVSYFSADSGLTKITDNGKSALMTASQEQLVALREVKKTQIQDYFGTIRKQVQTFSENGMIVDAMRDLNEAFHAFRDEQKLTPEQLAAYREELFTYYEHEFSEEYRQQNNGQEPGVDSYYGALDDDAIALQYHYVKANTNPLGSKHELDRSPVESKYNDLHGEVHPVVRNFLEEFGYYDIFLVDAETGDIVYSVFKELDYGTSLIDGPVAKTNFGEAFRRANRLTDPRDFVLVDFEQYKPSYEAPASFIASPIFDGETRLGVAMFQMPLDKVTQIMGERAGLGETGETLLVGPDFLPRSDSFRDAEHRSVVAAFRNAEQGKVVSDATQAVFDTHEAGVTVTQDYLGHESVAAYTPVDILGLKWALVAKRDTSEALAAVEEISAVAGTARSGLIWWAFGLTVAAGACVGVAAFFFAGSITSPIVKAAEFARCIASGNLTCECDAKATGEVGTLIQAMNDMQGSLRDIILRLTNNAGSLSASSSQLSQTASTLSSGADETNNQASAVSAAAEEMTASMNSVSASTNEMTKNVEAVAAAIEEMTASITEVAGSAERAAGVAGDAAQLTEVSNEKVSQLGNAADEIGKVIEVIQDIAEQTNLLALNATIEAARAGDAGKGFAVVATEVKELARQTSEATDDIARRIKAIQESSSEAITAIGEIEGVIRNVSDVSKTIAASVSEQQATTTNIARTVNGTTSAVQTVSRGISESALACQEITCNMGRVDKAARETASGASQTRSAGDDLLKIAEDIQELVGQFAV
jgi:methyl-accepting chemotaxis protein